MYFAPPQSMQVYFKLPVAYSFFVVPETSRLIARCRPVAAGSRQKYFIFLDQVARCFNASPACIPHHFNCIHKIQGMGPHPSRVPHAPRTGLSWGGPLRARHRIHDRGIQICNLLPSRRSHHIFRFSRRITTQNPPTLDTHSYPSFF